MELKPPRVSMAPEIMKQSEAELAQVRDIPYVEYESEEEDSPVSLKTEQIV
jgi:hypothetical protein